MRALEKLYAEGKIRAIAVSNFAVRDLEEARNYLSKTDIVSNQLRYNLLQRDIEEEVLPYCRKERISVLAWSPIAQGALTGKYNRSNIPKGDVRKGNVVFEPKNLALIQPLLRALSRVSRHHGSTLSQIALAWLMKDPLVIPIPGAKNSVQAEENADAAGIKLSREEFDEIGRVSRSLRIDYLPRFLR